MTSKIISKLMVKLEEGALAPKRANQFAAGFDLFAFENKLVEKKNKALVRTGVRMKVPEGYYGRIAPRSGLAAKHFLDVGAGVIDTDYRGEGKN